MVTQQLAQQALLRPPIAVRCSATAQRAQPSTTRRRRQPQLGGFGGPGNGGGSGNIRHLGGGGNSDDWNSNGDGSLSSTWSLQASSASMRWEGWEDRVRADPSFKDKVLIEQIIGVAASVAGDMASRPNWGLYELDFVFSTLVVGSILNFSLMYFLAPVASAAAAGSSLGLLQKITGPYFLSKWGAPAGHFFQPGFPASKRLVNFLYKGAIFSVIGMGAGITGTTLSNGLLALRKRLDPEFESPNKPPNVLKNAGTWATHMGVSSNFRYQAINGFDMVMQPKLAPGTFKALTTLLRLTNNVVGGFSFVYLAKLFKVQSSGDSSEQALATA